MIRKSGLMLKLEESNRERVILEEEIEECFNEFYKTENNPHRGKLLHSLSFLYNHIKNLIENPKEESCMSIDTSISDNFLNIQPNRRIALLFQNLGYA